MYHANAFQVSSLVLVGRTTDCDRCGNRLRTGVSAHLAGGTKLRCPVCHAVAPGGAELAVVDPGGELRVDARVVGRLARTAWVALRSAARVLWDRLRGRRSTGPVVVRRAFEDLGPAYVKLGQLVASTEGVFPEHYCAELRGCLDRVRPLPFAAIERVAQGELGRPLARVFSEIDATPLASASIAQVHAARLVGGEDVVIKVQRPGIDRVIDADVRILRGVAGVVARTPRGALANPVGVVEDFAQTLSEELDFRREAASMTEFNAILAGLDQREVVAPRVVDGLTTRRVLVMERFFGDRVDDVEALRARDLDLEAKLIAGMRAWFQGVVFHGFFHGDVHAGNLMALRDGRVGFLDFGIVGRLDAAQRRGVVDTLLCFAAGDFRKLAETWQRMGSCGAHVDLDALGRDLRVVYEPLVSQAVESVKYADLLPGVLRTAEKHGLKLPRAFVLVTKQMLYFDRYAKRLAPKLNVFRDERLVTPLAMDVLVAGMLA
jgi:predicted unusual protein kinase regulating ubiquinone biosynthesis (AarF/ABC1/UbiB family)